MASKKLQGITIEIDGNTTKLTDSLKDVNKAVSSTQSELKNINSLLKFDPSNTVLLGQKQQVLGEQISATKEKLSQLKKAQEDLDAKGVDKASEQYRELDREIVATNQQLSKEAKQLSETQDAMNGLGDSTKDASTHTLNLGDIIKGNLISDAIKSGLSALADGFKKIGETVLDVGKQALDSYADFQQLSGGVETLFGSSSSKVMENAQQAFSTEGMSANEYMETVTSFSASLINSLGGDTEKAVSYSDKAIQDMSDNANKMGTDLSSIQNAYQGFAKGNYTMLDNLKLGFSGSKEGMQQLLDKASEISGIKYDISSFADITDAIHVVQDSMGIAGTTSLEAGTTISGSINSMKASWENLLVGLADGSADMGALIQNFVQTIVGDGTENNLGVIGNILPVVQTLIKQIPTTISTLLPILLPIVIDLVKQVLTTLVQNLPAIVQAISDLFNALVDFLVDPDNLDMIIDCAVTLVVTLATGLIQALPKLLLKVPYIILKLATSLSEQILKVKWGELGLNVLKGILEGMLDFGNLVYNTIKKVGNKITDSIKSFFGIHSPSKLMKNEVGKFLPMGIAEGFKDEIPNTIDEVQDAMSELNSGIQASVNPTINPTANTNPLIIQIENFNNSRETDIQALAEELEFYRKNSSLAVGGN